MIEVVLPELVATELVVTALVVTELVELVRVMVDADGVVVLEADVVDDGVTGASTENAAYDTRIMTTMTTAMIAVLFLVIAVLKIWVPSIN
jgi:hypothetical protein